MLKLLCISIHTPNYSCLSELLPEIWGGSKNPRWRRGCAHAPEPPSGKKISTLLKLLIISIHVLNFSFLTQLLP